MRTENDTNTGREARFLLDGPASVQLALTLTDGRVRVFSYAFGMPGNESEAAAFRVAFTERVGNLISCLGGQKLTVCPGEALRRPLAGADGLIRGEKGCARAIRVADRINAALGLPPFAVEVTDAPVPPEEETDGVPGHLAERLRARAEKCLTGIRLGIDVGGTDIKAVAFRDGRLAAVKEFDWAPAEYGTPEEVTGPIVLIAKLLLAACGQYPVLSEPLRSALRKDAPLTEMAAAVRQAGTLPKGSSIGLSYPDVVIRDRIVGGETPKTKGMQAHDPAHYEDALRRLGSVREALAALLTEDGTLHLANDGNIAAYTAAAELSFCEDAGEIDRGVFAHSLGTDLGTGLLLGDGTFPEVPLELYTLRTGTEETEALTRPPEDIRSARTVQSGLRGQERRVGQAAAFRYAYECAPQLLDGYIEETDGVIRVITAPEDKRKALLEHLMACADAGDRGAEEVFVRIGRAFGDITLEAEALLGTGMEKRYLFGRFVKRERVFRLIKKGFSERCPGIRLVVADSALAKSPLMIALAENESVTVAQFGQAVGAVCYGA